MNFNKNGLILKQAKTLLSILGEKLPLRVSCTDNICEGCGLSLNRALAYKDRIYALIGENTGQRKSLFSHILRRVQQLNFAFFMHCRKKLSNFFY